MGAYRKPKRIECRWPGAHSIRASSTSHCLRWRETVPPTRVRGQDSCELKPEGRLGQTHGNEPRRGAAVTYLLVPTLLGSLNSLD